jgi:uncharacterized protein
LKEDVYAPRFRPDPSINDLLGFKKSELVITLRPPATEAHYHVQESDTLFRAVVEFLREQSNVKVVLLPRNAKQEAEARAAWPDLFASGKFVVPSRAVDGLNLIWHSDLMISGGGTMNREAAAMGVPVYSIFRGTIGAVDRYLAQTKRLVLIESPQDLQTKLLITRRDRSGAADVGNRETLGTIVNHIVSVGERKAESKWHSNGKPSTN